MVLRRLRLPLSDVDIRYRKHSRLLKVRLRPGHFDSDLQVAMELAVGDCYHLSEMQWEPELIIDAGGYMGLFTLAAAARWPKARIRLFEPLTDNLKAIRYHLEVNGLQDRVDVTPKAIGTYDGTATFFMRAAKEGSLDASMGYESKQDVEVFDAARLLPDIATQKTLIKLDIEGAEYDILELLYQKAVLDNVVMVMEVHGAPARYQTLLSQAREAGMDGFFYEEGAETAHLYLAGRNAAGALEPEKLVHPEL
jgi:FkbM family methyltransferase